MKKSFLSIILLLNSILIPQLLLGQTPQPKQIIGHIKWGAEDSFLPSIYMTDGNKKIFADWGGVYPLAQITRNYPKVYEEARLYEENARLAKWLSVGSLAFAAAAILGGIGDSDTLFTGGALGTLISVGASARYQAKAMYHLYRTVDMYNEKIKTSPRFGINLSTSF